MEKKILIIYTGGTIGMTEEFPGGPLIPFDFYNIVQHLPELKRFDLKIDVAAFPNPIDSSDMKPEIWQSLADIIIHSYSDYFGFVILHGTDTMAYTASALSFMLRGLQKPIIFTGSQLPIGKIRTDGKENLITAVEIASSEFQKQPVVQEVAICFGSKLLRGNRTYKHSAEGFDAFESPNYFPLAEIGVHLHFHQGLLLRSDQPFQPQLTLNTNIGWLKIFPGINPNALNNFKLNHQYDGLILETYGNGNIPQLPWLIEGLKEIHQSGTIILNISQCTQGSVNQQMYKNAQELEETGIVSGWDLTAEAAVTKLMHVLGNQTQLKERTKLLQENLAGEITIKAEMH
jgi:L-asparaginase